MSDLNMDDDAALEAAMEAEDREHGKQDDEVVEPVADEPTEELKAEDPEPKAEPEAEVEPEDKKPSGVASKDGKTVLPYAALKGARTETRRERDLRLQAEAERDALKKELEAIKAGKVEEPDPLDTMVEDFPATKALVEEVKALREQVNVRVTTPNVVESPSEDSVQEAIDSVPLLAGWQAADPEKWARATAIDNALRGSPKWANKPLEERFSHVAAMVADEFDIQTDDPAPKAKPTPRQDPDEVVKEAKRAAPNTLSDFKGGAPDPSRDAIDRLSPKAQMHRAMDMSDEEIERWLAKVG